MKFGREDIVSLYRRIANSSSLDIDDFIDQFKRGSELCTKDELQKLYSFLESTYPILAYITREILRIKRNTDVIILNETDINIYSTLALKYLVNSQVFQENRPKTQ